MRKHHIQWFVFTTVATIGTNVVLAQDYPAKPIRVYTSGVGGSSDRVARIIAPALSAALGQQVVIDARAAPISLEQTAKAAPDGYTLIVAGSGIITAPLLQVPPQEPLKDFAPITLAVSAPSVITVHPTMPIKTVKQLIDLARARPGELNYASGNTGSASHLTGELFNSMAGVRIVRVPYKAAGAAVADMVTGQVQVAYYSPGSVAPQVQGGKLRAIAVTSLQPSALVPGVPTVAATGLPGFEVLSTDSVFAPAKTPAAILTRVHRDVVRVLNQPDIKEKLLASGGEPIGNSPEAFSAWLKSEAVKWGKLIKETGMRAE
jgi:tripartite-type tricarboxylate transporter receptor subunit TctC